MNEHNGKAEMDLLKNTLDARTAKEKSSVGEFAQAVIRRKVYGKLPVGTKINGMEIDELSAGKFCDHGPDRIRPSKLEENVGQLHLRLFVAQDKLPDLVNSHVVSVSPSETEPGNMVLTIHFFQDRQAPNSRDTYTTAYVQTELPKDVMDKLLSEVTDNDNPDILEGFYQEVFDGLDSKGKAPGMRRVKAAGFYLITGSDLVRAGRTEYGPEGIRRFFQRLEKYHQYRNGPYGSGDVFTSILRYAKNRRWKSDGII